MGIKKKKNDLPALDQNIVITESVIIPGSPMYSTEPISTCLTTHDNGIHPDYAGWTMPVSQTGTITITPDPVAITLYDPIKPKWSTLSLVVKVKDPQLQPTLSFNSMILKSENRIVIPFRSITKVPFGFQLIVPLGFKAIVELLPKYVAIGIFSFTITTEGVLEIVIQNTGREIGMIEIAEEFAIVSFVKTETFTISEVAF